MHSQTNIKFVSVGSTVLSLFKPDFSTQNSDSQFEESHGQHAYSSSFERPRIPLLTRGKLFCRRIM